MAVNGISLHPAVLSISLLMVVSDSKYVVDAVEKKWVFGWEKKGFKDKANPDLWKRFLKVYRKHQVDFKWIKGHNNHPQNERCDELGYNVEPDNEGNFLAGGLGNDYRFELNSNF